MKVLLRIVVASISLGVVLTFAGCENQGPAEQAGRQIDKVTQQAGDKAKEAGTAVSDKIEKAGDYVDDAAITAKVKGDIMSDPMLKVLDISVRTVNGVVILSGDVDAKPSIDRAGEIAGLVDGVKSVQNNLYSK
ncbi:MAG: BON domain-containing protein [Gammaproteobacteria bacterium]